MPGFHLLFGNVKPPWLKYLNKAIRAWYKMAEINRVRRVKGIVSAL